MGVPPAVATGAESYVELVGYVAWTIEVAPLRDKDVGVALLVSSDDEDSRVTDAAPSPILVDVVASPSVPVVMANVEAVVEVVTVSDTPVAAIAVVVVAVDESVVSEAVVAAVSKVGWNGGALSATPARSCK